MLKRLCILTGTSLLLAWPAAATIDAPGSLAPFCSTVEGVEGAPAVAFESLPGVPVEEPALPDALVTVHPAVESPTAVLFSEGDAFVHSSSRAMKEGLAPIDSAEVLARVVGLPLSTWSYKSDDGQVRHLGPMAEDFFAAFALGHDEKGISLIDTGGVALAAIQGLYRKVEEKAAEAETLRRDAERRIDALTRQNADLAARLAALEEQLQSLAASSSQGPKGVEVAPAVPDPPLR